MPRYRCICTRYREKQKTDIGPDIDPISVNIGVYAFFYITAGDIVNCFADIGDFPNICPDMHPLSV
jgi:hypothetical protein